jgi:hypothetical protein
MKYEFPMTALKVADEFPLTHPVPLSLHPAIAEESDGQIVLAT